MSMLMLPLVQSIPHGGLLVPVEVVNRLAIDETTIYNESDLWADDLYDFQQPTLDRPAQALGVVSFEIARVLIDANRPPDSLEDPDGVVKTTTSYGNAIYRTPLTTADQIALRQRYWTDYHRRLDESVRQHAGEMRFFLDCHTMAQRGPTAYGDAGKVRPLLCISNNGDGRGESHPQRGWISASPALTRRAAEIAEPLFRDLTLLEPNAEQTPIVALNQPFPGGYILRRYTDPAYTESFGAHYPGLMVEINRGLYVGNQATDTPVQPPNGDRIAAVRERLADWVQQLMAELP